MESNIQPVTVSTCGDLADSAPNRLAEIEDNLEESESASKYDVFGALMAEDVEETPEADPVEEVITDVRNVQPCGELDGAVPSRIAEIEKQSAAHLTIIGKLDDDLTTGFDEEFEKVEVLEAESAAKLSKPADLDVFGDLMSAAEDDIPTEETIVPNANTRCGEKETSLPPKNPIEKFDEEFEKIESIKVENMVIPREDMIQPKINTRCGEKDSSLPPKNSIVDFDNEFVKMESTRVESKVLPAESVKPATESIAPKRNTRCGDTSSSIPPRVEEAIAAVEEDFEKKESRAANLMSAGKLETLSAKQDERDPNSKLTGTVKWFNVKAGYGFIKRDDTGAEIFVHHSGILRCNPNQWRSSLGDNEKVEFDIVQSDSGPRAVSVTGPNGSSVIGSIHARGHRFRGGGRGQRRGRSYGMGFGMPLPMGINDVVSFEPSRYSNYGDAGRVDYRYRGRSRGYVY